MLDGIDILTRICPSIQHPWGEGSGSKGWSGSAGSPYCDWQDVVSDVYGYNGFSFLSIVDFPNPAPRNNHFWHYHRKVLIDAFSQHPDRVGTGSGGKVCNPSTNEYYNYTDSSFNVVNMWISGLPATFEPNPGGLTGNSQRFLTTCNGGKATRGLQSAAEMQPELMPYQYYTFAIERNTTGYTLEVSGNFARAGFKVSDDMADSIHSFEQREHARHDNLPFIIQMTPSFSLSRRFVCIASSRSMTNRYGITTRTQMSTTDATMRISDSPTGPLGVPFGRTNGQRNRRIPIRSLLETHIPMPTKGWLR